MAYTMETLMVVRELHGFCNAWSYNRRICIKIKNAGKTKLYCG